MTQYIKDQHPEVKRLRNEPLLPAKKDSDSLSWDVLFFLMLDTVNIQNDLADTRATAQKFNVDRQMEINDKYKDIRFDDIPQDCWAQVPKTKMVPVWDFKERRRIWVEVPDGYETQVVDQVKLNAYLTNNKLQMEQRQDLQNNMATLQMRASATSTGVDTAVKSASQSSGMNVALIDVLMALTDRINNKRG